ncbi:formyl transferase [Candidatus Kaiserbacteria bacterium]|nr:formyl transferase [Candidatus Kaiserbacteria bacterium]
MTSKSLIEREINNHDKENPVVVIFSSQGSALLPIILKEFSVRNISVAANILDGSLDDRSKSIQVDRTLGFFDWPDFDDIESYMIPRYDVTNHNGDDTVDILNKLKVDIIINAGTPRILKKHILDIPTQGVVNTHPGILPAYRGCTAVEWSLYNNDPVGATCHFMMEGIDEGPIIYSEIMPVVRGDQYEAVRANMIYHWASVTAKGVEKIIKDGSTMYSLPLQDVGMYYEVIPEDKLIAVKEKLLKGLYKCYITSV